MPQKKTKVIREIPENPFIQGQAKRKKLRVAAYCRVSTEQEEQESSFENQVAYYTDLIQSNPEWEFAGIFADRGISGTKDTIRPEFMKMIEHCQRHKIDLIFTKSLSRFSRNTLDSIKYIRLLKSLNVTIEFEKEGLNTSDAVSYTHLQRVPVGKVWTFPAIWYRRSSLYACLFLFLILSAKRNGSSIPPCRTISEKSSSQICR